MRGAAHAWPREAPEESVDIPIEAGRTWMGEPQAVTPIDLADLQDGVSAARGALDDLWFAAVDMTREEPILGTTAEEIHELAFKVASNLRGVELDLKRLRSQGGRR